MPARPPVASVCQVRIQYEVGDKIAENILHFSYSPFGPAPLAYVTALATAVDAAVSSFPGLWGTTTDYLGTTATDLDTDTGFSFEANTPATGTRTGGILPANVALLASYSVARRWRGGHPRQYLPWFTETDIDSPQLWLEGSIGDANTTWADILGNALAAAGGGFITADQVVVSYITAGEPRVVPLVNPIDFVECDLMIASQRRRDGRH